MTASPRLTVRQIGNVVFLPFQKREEDVVVEEPVMAASPERHGLSLLGICTGLAVVALGMCVGASYNRLTLR